MTYQPAVHSRSTPCPPSFPPLLLSSSKGFKDWGWIGAVSVGSAGIAPWNVNSRTTVGRPRNLSPLEDVHLCNPNPLPQLGSLGGNRRGQAVDWRWNVKNSRSDRCGFPEEKP